MNRPLFFGLRARLALLLMLAVCPLGVLMLFNIMDDQRREADQLEQYTVELARLIAHKEEQEIEGARQLLVDLAQLPPICDPEPKQINAFLADLISHYTRFANLLVATADGIVQGRAVPLKDSKDLSNRKFFRRAVRTGEFSIGRYQAGHIAPEPSLPLAYPIRDAERQSRGVIVASLRLNWLQDRLAQFLRHIYPAATSTIVDANGVVLARYSPNPRPPDQEFVPKPSLLASLNSQDSMVIEPDRTETASRIYAVATVESLNSGTGFYAILGIPKNVLFGATNQSQLRNLIFLGVGTGFVLVLYWYTSSALVLRPVELLTRMTRRIASGDFSARIGSVRKFRELGQLATAFDQMAEALTRREVERRRAELDAHAHRHLLEKTFASLDEAIFVVDLPSRMIVMCNEAVKSVFGYEKEEVIGRNTAFLHVDGESYLKFGRRLFPALGQAGIFRGENQMRRKDGGLFFTEHTVTEIRDDSGRQHQVVSIVRDITIRKESEAKLRRRTELLQTIFDNIPVMIVFIDADGRTQWINRYWEQVLGWSLEEVKQHEMLSRMYPDPQVRQEVLDFAIKSSGVWRDFRTHTKAGHVIPTSWANVKLSDGTCIGLGIDATELKRVEESLHELSGQLLRLQDEERRRLARELHDTTAQKLAAVLLNLKQLQSEFSDLPDLAQEFLADSHALAEQCANEIRTFSYLLHPPLLDELGLAGAVRDYADGFARRSGIRADLEISAELNRLPREVELTAFRVLQEALTNVHRHAESRTVSIRLHQTNGELRLEIQDAGTGLKFDADLLPDQSAISRLGVGLVGMRERLRQLGGRLEIRSGPKGTAVKAILPWKQAAKFE